jgi:hypothetical protein
MPPNLLKTFWFKHPRIVRKKLLQITSIYWCHFEISSACKFVDGNLLRNQIVKSAYRKTKIEKKNFVLNFWRSMFILWFDLISITCIQMFVCLCLNGELCYMFNFVFATPIIRTWSLCHFNKKCSCMSSDFIGFWVNSLVVTNRDQWNSEFTGLVNGD